MALSAQRIAAIMAAIDELTDNNLLTWTSLGFDLTDLDASGMPADWTSEVGRMSAEQRAEISGYVANIEADWAKPLRL